MLRRNWHPSYRLWPTACIHGGWSTDKICSRSTTTWVCGDNTQATKEQAKQQDQQHFRKSVIQWHEQGTILTWADPNAVSNSRLEREGPVTDMQCFWHDSIIHHFYTAYTKVATLSQSKKQNVPSSNWCWSLFKACLCPILPMTSTALPQLWRLYVRNSQSMS